MRRSIVFIVLMALLTAGCHHKTKGDGQPATDKFSTHTLSDQLCYITTYDEEVGPWGNSVGAKVSYAVVWPDEGTVSAAALRELQYFYFGDSTANSVEEAAKSWLSKSFFGEEDNGGKKQFVESIDEDSEYSYMNLESNCTQDSTLVTFTKTSEGFIAGAAHDMYAEEYLTIDLETGNVVHLHDLVSDTSLLCEAIAHALHDLDINTGLLDCIFDEFRTVERMPMPRNFLIDSARNGITVYYGLYEIAPYACGIQEVTLPIFWLSKHAPLTPYAKRIFGPGCSL